MVDGREEGVGGGEGNDREVVEVGDGKGWGKRIGSEEVEED